MRVYISADYDVNSGDRDVVEVLNGWSKNSHLLVTFTDMAKVVSGSVSEDPDCRICDLKKEFNKQINLSSYVIFVIGDKTASRTAGSNCERNSKSQYECTCTPYKKNASGSIYCKVPSTYDVGPSDDVGCINKYSYLRHEFEQAKKKNKNIVVVYNSLIKQSSWLPWYMSEYETVAVPFWTRNSNWEKVGNYTLIKNLLGL